MRSAPASTPRTEPSKNQFALANKPLTERTGHRLGHVIPIQIFDIAAAVANEVVMPHAFGVETRGTALDSNFPYQASPHQVSQIVIRCGPGRAGIDAIDGFENFRGRGMAVTFEQKCHHGVPLRSTA